MAKRRGLIEDMKRKSRLPALDEQTVAKRGAAGRKRDLANRLKNLLSGSPSEKQPEAESPRVYNDEDESSNE